MAQYRRHGAIQGNCNFLQGRSLNHHQICRDVTESVPAGLIYGKDIKIAPILHQTFRPVDIFLFLRNDSYLVLRSEVQDLEGFLVTNMQH